MSGAESCQILRIFRYSAPLTHQPSAKPMCGRKSPFGKKKGFANQKKYRVKGKLTDDTNVSHGAFRSLARPAPNTDRSASSDSLNCCSARDAPSYEMHHFSVETFFDVEDLFFGVATFSFGTDLRWCLAPLLLRAGLTVKSLLL